MTERVVVLIDMDCFYVQVEERDNPHIRGVPAAVVQYNTWRGGGIIAVNYEARGYGVKRGMRGDEAREKCPDIQLIQVPVSRGKADLTKYRDAGKEVIMVLTDFGDCVERASIDEAYVECTAAVEKRLANASGERITASHLPSTWVVGQEEEKGDDKQASRESGIQEWLSEVYGSSVGCSAVPGRRDDLRLAVAAALCEEMRCAVLQRTNFKCSAGIAHNKMLAKLSCGLHKPNQQTVLPQSEVPGLWEGMVVGKVRNLGGKLGDSLTEDLGCVTMGDLSRISLPQLAAHYDEKTTHWLHQLGRGIDTELVTSRHLPKSIGCGKNFQGREALTTPEKVQSWMRNLAEELAERLDVDCTANKRRAKTLTVSVRLDGDERWCSLSRSCPLSSYAADRITRLALALIQHTNQAPNRDTIWSPAVRHMGLSASKFEDIAGQGSANIQEMFRKVAMKTDTSTKTNAMDNNEVTSTPQATMSTTPETFSTTAFSRESVPTSKTKASQGSTSGPSRGGVACKTGTLTQKPTNSFFKNFLLKKLKPVENEVCAVSDGDGNIQSGGEIGDGNKRFNGDERKDGSHPNGDDSEDSEDDSSEYSYDDSTEEDEAVNGDKGSSHKTYSEVEGFCDTMSFKVNNKEDGFNNNGEGYRVNSKDREGRCNVVKNSAPSVEENPDCTDLDILTSLLDGDSDAGDSNSSRAQGSTDSQGNGGAANTTSTFSPDLFSSSGEAAKRDRGEPLSERESSLESSDKTVELFTDADCVMQPMTKEKEDTDKSVDLFSDTDSTEPQTKADTDNPVELVTETDSNKVKDTIKKQETKEVTVEPPSKRNKALEPSTKRNTLEASNKRGNREAGSSEHRTSDTGQCQVSVRELFPDLDNFDASLLPLLPQELRVQLQGELTRHKDNQQNKSGIMKYIQRSPKKHIEPSAAAPSGQGDLGAGVQSAAEGDLVECHECHRQVWAFELPEHMDYHVAVKLQTDLRRGAGTSASSSGSTRATGARRGRKRGRQPATARVDDKKIQKLDSFFTR